MKITRHAKKRLLQRTKGYTKHKNQLATRALRHGVGYVVYRGGRRMNSDAYTDLYAAVFKLAVMDDTKKTMDLIVKDLEKTGLERPKALRLASTVKQKVSEEIKEIIYEEAKKWPKTKRSTSSENLIKIKNKYLLELGRKSF